jgi:Leucine-rich repeat (LRR) protein
MFDSLPLPGILPAKFEQYAEIKSDQELFEALVQNPAELVEFFRYACEDETWSTHKHTRFTKLALHWFEQKALERKLSLEYIYDIADAIQLHAEHISPFIHRGITAHLEDGQENISALLMIACSDILRELVDAHCEVGKNPNLTFKLTRTFFKPFQEYFVTGAAEELWRETPASLHEIMAQARKWDLEELAILCEDVLKRYIDRANVFERLLEAHAKRWPHLKNACIDYINHMNLGIQLERGESNQLICYLHDLSFITLDNYAAIKAEVTRLVFRGKTPQETGFSEVIRETPKLVSLDLSETDAFTPAYLELPSKIDELLLNRCPWLDSTTLPQLLQACPNITKLQMISNPQLDLNAFASLQQLKNLSSLNLARCNLNDNVFKVVLAATRQLEELNVNECMNITAFGFTELARVSPELIYLHASKTEIDDGSLAEVGMHCKRLLQLDVSRCANVSIKGIRELVRLRPTLRTLDLAGCSISHAHLQEIKKEKPRLILIDFKAENI